MNSNLTIKAGLLDRLLLCKGISRQDFSQGIIDEIQNNHLDVKIAEFKINEYGDYEVISLVDSSGLPHEHCFEDDFDLNTVNIIVFNLYEYYEDKKLIELMLEIKNDISTALSDVCYNNVVLNHYRWLQRDSIDKFILIDDLIKMKALLLEYKLNKQKGDNNDRN